MTWPGDHRHSATWKHFATECEPPAHEVGGLAAGSAALNPNFDHGNPLAQLYDQVDIVRKPMLSGTQGRPLLFESGR